MNWKKYKFKIWNINDIRPIIINKKIQYKCTGYDRINNRECANMEVCLLVGDSLKNYWPDAFEIISENISSTINNK